MKKISAVLLSVIFVISLGILSGCSDMFGVKVSSVSFAFSETSITVGEKIELNKYVSVRPSKARNKGYEIESSNPDVVEIETVKGSGVVSKIYAKGKSIGKATLTVTTNQNGKTASMEMEVTYAQPSDLKIVPPDSFALLADTVIIGSDVSDPVDFAVEIPEKVDPDLEIYWSASHSYTANKYLTVNEVFEFIPRGVGQSVITATATDSKGNEYSDSIKVNVSDEVNGIAVSDYGGSLEQTPGEYETVGFRLSYSPLPIGNPDPVIVWYVNGEQAGTGKEFGFLPSSPGKYEISANVNGVEFDANTVFVRGSVVPQNVWLDYDDCYPKVYVRWDSVSAAAGFEVSIVDTLTGRAVASDLNTMNAAVRNKFTDSGFDATDYLTGTYNVFDNRFTVKVRTLGDENNVIQTSAWSDNYFSDKVPVRAKSYLEKKFYDGARNYYVKSYEEFYEWFEYAMLWRPPSVENGETLYLDYNFGSALDVIERAMQKDMHFTGSYGYSASADARNKKECTFAIQFRSDGTPSLRTSEHSGSAWNALRPHINYDVSKVRSARHVFPIDSKTPVTVETSEQLYYIAQLGYRPVPVAGSAAERLYNYARRTLRYIISDDMTDVEKLHAIYDWIMWRVTYDNEVLRYDDLEDAVKYESYYLESVFTDTDHYGVCDAMSKAFALMSSVEGFESLRITGVAGTGAEQVGHAWNKVKLYGNWYIVDCTWGDASIQVFKNGAYRESASHMYFLVSDADVANTHTEDESSRFPKSAAKRYPWYEELTVDYSNDVVDFYIDDGISESEFKSEINTLCAYMVKNADNGDTSYTVGPGNVTYSSYYCYEIISDSSWGKDERSLLYLNLVSGMLRQGQTSNRDYYISMSPLGDLVHWFVFIKL